MQATICLDMILVESLNLDKKNANLDSWENLATFKKLVSKIEKSWSRSRFLHLVSMAFENPVLFGRDWDLSRLVNTYVIFCHFSGFLNFFLDLDREMDIYKYLDQDFSSKPFLFTFCASKLASKWAKSAGNSNFFKKSW